MVKNRALIYVSLGANTEGCGKADMFYQKLRLMEGYNNDDIQYIGPIGCSYRKQDLYTKESELFNNKQLLISGLKNLRDNYPDDEGDCVIYIQDHCGSESINPPATPKKYLKLNPGNPHDKFGDPKTSEDLLEDDYLENLFGKPARNFSGHTYEFILGPYSALFGLSIFQKGRVDPYNIIKKRSIMTSEGPDDNYDQELYNICIGMGNGTLFVPGHTNEINRLAPLFQYPRYFSNY